MNVTASYIEISGLRVFAHHGVLEQERKVGNDFVVDVRLTYDALKAMDTDNLQYAINYADAVDTIQTEMAKPSALLENVAARIARALSGRFQAVTAGTVTVAKCKPPVTADIASASFTLAWTV